MRTRILLVVAIIFSAAAYLLFGSATSRCWTGNIDPERHDSDRVARNDRTRVNPY